MSASIAARGKTQYLALSTTLPQLQSDAAPRLALRLLGDDKLLERFRADPSDVMKSNGLDAATNVQVFVKLVEDLRGRAEGWEPALMPKKPPKPDETIQRRAVKESSYKNMDNSSNSIVRYEERINVYKEKGVRTNSDVSEDAQTSRGFQRNGDGPDVEHLFKFKLFDFFFPGQPLVSPKLIRQLRLAWDARR